MAGFTQTSSGSTNSTVAVQIPTEVQAKLDKLNADLKAAQAKNDAAGELKAAYAIGYVYAGLGDRQEALDYLSQALTLSRKVGDRAGEAATLNSSGVVYSSLGENQKALDCYNQLLAIRRLMANRVGEAFALARIGTVYEDIGENQKALDYYTQALLIWHQVGDRADEAKTMNNIGTVYSHADENQKALDYFIKALAIKRQLGDRIGEAKTLTNIGNVYFGLDEMGKALDNYNLALPIERQEGDRAGEARTMASIGNVYIFLGDKEKALDLYNQALPIWRLVGDRAGEALTLGHLAMVYSDLGENRRALGLYDQAFPIFRQEVDRLPEAAASINIGIVNSRLGEKQKALDYFNQALLISRQRRDPAGEAGALNNIGSVYFDLGGTQKALDYSGHALQLATFASDPMLKAVTLTDLSRFEEPDRPSLAILYGKLAVNLLQQMRGKISGLQDDLQKSFLASVADKYRHLAALLIKQGRLSEAQQVLNLLKDQEYKDYVRGEVSDTLSPLTLTPAERSAEEDYQRSTAKVVEQGRRWSELKQNKLRTPEQDKEFQQLSDSLGNASQLMSEYFARLYKLFAAGGDANRQVANITDETASLKQQIAKMPHTVALYTVVSEGRYSVIVITGQTMVAREYAIPDKDLYQKVAAFRQIILDPSKDPKPLAEELYKILIAPIKADLDQAKAETLIWSLDGVLRYVPFAALYDGRHYLIENYSLASFTPVSIAHISDRPHLAAVSAAGMGISGKFDEKLKPLPKVETELDSIVQDPQVKGSSSGVMHGTILLNANFTEQAMEKQLDGQHAVVHIASHFVMRPGDDSQSYLLMAGKDGDAAGYHMTVASFRDNQKMSLEGTELLTLSACDTGIGGSAASGREVDGLATTAQRKGAKSVISSLWQINDNSTADLMADFYKRWIDGGGKMTKAEALRQAQLDLLLGKLTSKPDTSNPNASTSYAPPYYWAPFVLMGNWQ